MHADLALKGGRSYHAYKDQREPHGGRSIKSIKAPPLCATAEPQRMLSRVATGFDPQRSSCSLKVLNRVSLCPRAVFGCNDVTIGQRLFGLCWNRDRSSQGAGCSPQCPIPTDAIPPPCNVAVRAVSGCSLADGTDVCSEEICIPGPEGYSCGEREEAFQALHGVMFPSIENLQHGAGRRIVYTPNGSRF